MMPMSSTREAVSLDALGISLDSFLFVSLAARGRARAPADALFQLRGECQQQIVAAGGADELDANGDAVGGLVDRQRDRGLASHAPDPHQRAEAHRVVGD